VQSGSTISVSGGLVSAIASDTDLEGNPREVPAIRSASPLDLGAYDYQHRAPAAVATAAPSSAPTGSAITFDGSRRGHDDDRQDRARHAASAEEAAPPASLD
jgi:hypothetical protein